MGVRPRGSRILALLLLGLWLPGASGCFVFEELDAGNETMEQHFSSNRDQPANANPARQEPGGQAPAQPGFFTRLRAGAVAGWNTFRGKSPEAEEERRGPAEKPVRCRVGGKIEFTSASACRVRGGSVL